MAAAPQAVEKFGDGFVVTCRPAPSAPAVVMVLYGSQSEAATNGPSRSGRRYHRAAVSAQPPLQGQLRRVRMTVLRL